MHPNDIKMTSLKQTTKKRWVQHQAGQSGWTYGCLEDFHFSYSERHNSILSQQIRDWPYWPYWPGCFCWPDCLQCLQALQEL